MTGNLLGVRRYYRYEDDTGLEYSYLTDQDLGTAVGAVEDDSLPPFPRRFKPRGVYCQATINNRLVRKFVIIPEVASSTLWENSSNSITIDSQAFTTTGRRGEQISYGTNPPTQNPAPNP